MLIWNFYSIPFGKAQWSVIEGKDPPDYRFECQHGPMECDVNQLMNCAMKRLNNETARYLPFIFCAQQNNFDEALKCSEASGLDPEDLRKCANGVEGRTLHYESGRKTKALQPPLRFVPTIFMQGHREQKAFRQFKSTVCESIEKMGRPKPSLCGGDSNLNSNQQDEYYKKQM